MASFVELSELEDRLDFDLDDKLSVVALSALEDLTEDALHYGKSGWTVNTCPRRVKSLILRAAKRFMDNNQGLVQSRAGDETLIFNEDKSGEAGTPRFSDSEIEQIQGIASGGRNRSFGSFGTFAWSNRAASRHISPLAINHDPNEYVPVADGGSPFPLLAGDE